jgi:hypothetical protein
MIKNPKVFLILKIIGILFLGLSVYGFVLFFQNFGDFGFAFIGGIVLGVISLFIGALCLILGFAPTILKRRIAKIAKMQNMSPEEVARMMALSAQMARNSNSK